MGVVVLVVTIVQIGLVLVQQAVPQLRTSKEFADLVHLVGTIDLWAIGIYGVGCLGLIVLEYVDEYLGVLIDGPPSV